MKDIKEEILAPYRQHKIMINRIVPANCAAGRCGHKSINAPTIAFNKENVLNAMDNYAACILQYMYDNNKNISIIPDFNAKDFLHYIKENINNETKKQRNNKGCNITEFTPKESYSMKVHKDSLTRIYDNVTLEDIRKWEAEIDAMGITERKFPEAKVEDLGNGYVKLSSGHYSIIPKDVWNKAVIYALK